MIRWKHLPILLSALLCTASCDLGSAPGGGGTEGEGLTGRLQDPSGRAIAGVLVRVFPEANASAKSSAMAAAVFDSVYSDSRGFFRFDGLPAGDYGLRTYARRNDTTLVLLLRQIPYGGGDKSLGTQTMVVGGKIRMQVRGSATGPSAPGSPGSQAPLQGTLCQIVDLPISAQANDSGFCELDALPPGQYAVRLSHPGFDDYVTAPIEVRPGQSAGQGPWLLQHAGVPARRYATLPSTRAHWTFDTISLGSFADIAKDSITLQISGAVVPVTSQYGKAAGFSGASSLQTQRVVPALSGLASRYLTLEARVRLPMYPAASNRDSASLILGAPRGYSLLVRSNGSIAVGSPIDAVDSNSDWKVSAAWSAAGVVPIGQWVDLAVSIDKTTLQAYAFVNGSVVQLRNHNATLPNGPGAANPFYVGRAPADNRSFVGEIDEARVSDSLVLGAGLPLALADSSSVYPYVRSFSHAVADAEISAPASPATFDPGGLSNLNHGAMNSLAVGAQDTGIAFRSLLRFRLPPGIQPSQINRAVIRMRTKTWYIKNGQGGTRINLHRVLQGWNEGSGLSTANSAAINGVTGRQRFWDSDPSADWNTRFMGLNDIDASASPITSDSMASLSLAPWEWDVTALAREWAADTAQNFGVLLASALPGGAGPLRDYPSFHSREAALDSLRPMLIINGEPVARPNAKPNFDVNVIADADVTISYAVPGYPDVQGYGALNRGKEPLIGASTYDMSSASRALVRFPVAPHYLPNIVSAKIRFTTAEWTPKNTRRPYTIDLHRMLKSWKEGNAAIQEPNSATIDGATGLDRFWGSQDGLENWSAPLVGLDDVDAARAPTASLTKNPGSTEAWEFDVTELARSWAADSSRNFGVMLATEIPATNAEVWDYPRFHSREAATPAQRPLLILTLSQ